jgi:hypothetical protein
MPMPLQGDAASFSGYHNAGVLLNSIAWENTGLLATKQRDISFERMSLEQSRNLNDLIFKKYGTGYIYFHDPFCENILSSYLSMPYLMVEEGIPYFSRFGSISTIDVPDNPFELPLQGISISFDGIDTPRRFGFVVPPNSKVAYSIKGEPSDGGFYIKCGDTYSNLPVSDTSTLWDGFIEATGFCEFFADLVGDMTIYGIMLSVVNEHATIPSVTRKYPRFITGTGMSGATLSVDSIERGEYAYTQNWAFDYASLTLRETEWGSQ